MSATSCNLPDMIPAALQETIDALRKTPQIVSDLVTALSDKGLRSKYSGEEFSALENVCHLRDIELEGYTRRIARILSETKPLLPDVDGSRLAAERDYNSGNLDQSLRAFALARSNNIQTLQGLTREQSNREATLEGVGEITLERLLQMMQEHDEDHIRELEVICRRLARGPSESAQS